MVDFKKISSLETLDLIDYIITEFHVPLRENIVLIKKYGINIKKDCGDKVKNLDLLFELFNQFEQEIINHINKEETEFFPEIINLYKGNNKKNNNLKTFLRLQESEHNEIDNYLIGGKNVIENLCLDGNKAWLKLKKVVEKLHSEILLNIYIEDEILNKRVKSFLEEN